MANLRQPPPAPEDAAVEAAAAIGLADEFGTGTLLLSDLRTAFLIADEARHRVIARLFAVSSDQENLLTFVAALALADALQRWVRRLHLVPGAAMWGDSFLGASAARETLCAVAGPVSREPPMMGTLLALAVVGGTAAPTVVKSLRAMKTGSHRTAVSFHRRYGYLVDPGHLRERRAQARVTNGRP